MDNPRPGTVVDHSVTPDGLYDFYLISPHVRQGVATPSHYSILYDGINSKPEDIISMTYRLCFLYYNFSGPVKIPAPIKYADKLAKLHGERKNFKAHNGFSNINGLYFI